VSPGLGIGVRATRNVAQGDALFALDQACAIDAGAALGDRVIGRALRELREEHRGECAWLAGLGVAVGSRATSLVEGLVWGQWGGLVTAIYNTGGAACRGASR
jgi:hypothetical protein